MEKGTLLKHRGHRQLKTDLRLNSTKPKGVANKKQNRKDHVPDGKTEKGEHPRANKTVNEKRESTKLNAKLAHVWKWNNGIDKFIRPFYASNDTELSHRWREHALLQNLTLKSSES